MRLDVSRASSPLPSVDRRDLQSTTRLSDVERTNEHSRHHGLQERRRRRHSGRISFVAKEILIGAHDDAVGMRF